MTNTIKISELTLGTLNAGESIPFLDSDGTTKRAPFPTVGDMLKTDNLSGLSNYGTARTNLGLGTLATQSGTFSGTSSGTNTGDQTSIVGITGTKAQFDTACTDGNFLYTGDNATSLNMSTARILGRSTASSGAVEEISIGSGLSLSGGTISATASGGLTRDIWYSLTGTFATASTFTTTESSSAEATRLAGLAERALFTCTNSGGSTRRIGYIKSATTSTTTVTYTVVTDSDLASGDIGFKIAPQRMVEDYKHIISIPGEQIADTSNPQGTWLLNIKRDAYLLPVNTAVRTAAAGSGAALAYNVYKGTTNLFTTAPDMTTNTTLSDQRPNTNTITAGDNISLRITSSAGATNKASDFQAELYIIPQKLYTSQ